MEEVLAEKLVRLREYTQLLEEHSGVSWDEFNGNRLLYEALENLLRKAVESCLSIGELVIAANGWEEAQTYRDVFRVLTAHGVLANEELTIFERMAGFRNILIHEYDRVDKAAVFGLLKRRLEDFRRFARHITEFAAKQQP